MGSCHSSDRERSDLGSAADSGANFIEVLISMDSKKLKSAYGNDYNCFSCPASYKVDSAYGSLTKVKIPYDSRTALEDKHFGYCWKLAMEAEVVGKFAADFPFEYVYTIPECRTVMKGMWIFTTKSDP